MVQILYDFVRILAFSLNEVRSHSRGMTSFDSFFKSITLYALLRIDYRESNCGNKKSSQEARPRMRKIWTMVVYPILGILHFFESKTSLIERCDIILCTNKKKSLH